MEQGWDSDVTRFFRKILNTISWFLIWLIAAITAGIYYKLGYPGEHKLILVIIFYVCLITSLFFLLRYFFRTWSKS